MPQHTLVVTCFMGCIDSGQQASWQTFRDNPIIVDEKAKGQFGETGGPTAEVEWYFLGRRGDVDRYQVTLRYPVDAPDCKVQTAEVSFAGKRFQVFEDPPFVVVLDPPKHK